MNAKKQKLNIKAQWCLVVAVFLCLCYSSALIADSPSKNILFNQPQQVTENVWSAIGATAPPKY